MEDMKRDIAKQKNYDMEFNKPTPRFRLGEKALLLTRIELCLDDGKLLNIIGKKVTIDYICGPYKVENKGYSTKTPRQAILRDYTKSEWLELSWSKIRYKCYYRQNNKSGRWFLDLDEDQLQKIETIKII